MTDPKDATDPDEPTWDFEGTRRQHLLRGLRMTPAERLQWLEETVDEMRRLQGLAVGVGPIEDEKQKR
jgi:hypothetical protein